VEVMTGQPQSVKVEELQVRRNGGMDRGVVLTL
jgi:hypothetical protein